ncbi:sodium:calcium antiporter [Amnibacterium endophyticum]|uniref:Sodium:calcium antiporter n=1 Tax=Amnibacterium endophyticum TaxID=2109337 RepID=A0ABW4LG51_9MICO
MTAWPFWPSVLALLGSVVVIVFAGSRLARAADELADRTGLGEAIAGAVFLGVITSLPGIVTTATGSLAGDAEFALANPIGGVALQTVWLAIADLVYRRANLEHAAASLENMLQAVVLMGLLALPVVAFATPQLLIGWFHPVTIAIPILYVAGLRLVQRMQTDPMWQPVRTRDTRDDQGDDGDEGRPLPVLWGTLAGLGLVVAVTGWVIGQAGLGVVAATGWPSGITGFTVTTAVTSLPELIVLIAAIRQGALTLGVGNIIGGNVFDVLTLPVADAFYLDGSIYRAAGPTSLVLLGGTILITAVLAAGLLVRDRRGVGFEGLGIPAAYVGTVGLAIVAR